MTGRGNYVNDVDLPNIAHASFLRSPHAHAKINGIDISEASRAPGVLKVITGAEIVKNLPPIPRGGELVLGSGLKQFTRWALPIDKTRFVGEPIVGVVAEDKSSADDALDLIKVDYELLEPVIDPEKVLQEKGNGLYEGWEDNVMAKQNWSGGDVDGAFKKADVVIKERMTIARTSGSPIENRGLLVNYDRRSEKLTIWVNTQTPHMSRSSLALAIAMGEERIRLISPDVGGGFGSKGGVYLESIVACHASKEIGRPVKWIEDRTEHLISSQHGRDQIHNMEIAVTKDGKVLGLKDMIVADVGSPLFQNIAPGGATARMITGCYKIQDFATELNSIATCKGPTGPIRGYGKSEGIMAIEMLMDVVARELGLDPTEVRRKNFIQPEEFPYRTGPGHFYDSGDYPGALDKVLELSNYKKLREEQTKMRKDGRLIGIGISSYVDSSGLGPSRRLGMPFYETATVRVDGSGKVKVLCGTHSQGQSHETTFGKICSDELSISIDDITVIYGDTDLVPTGTGTFSSRSCVVAGSAILLASRKVKEKMVTIAAHLLEVGPEKIDLNSGKFMVKGDVDKSVSFKEVASISINKVAKLPDGVEPGVIDCSASFDPQGSTFDSGCHLVLVEVQPDTGYVSILNYFAIDDVGKVMNELAVEGQTIGGIAHGVGNALFEEMVYAPNGVPLTGTFDKYFLLNMVEVPNMVLGRMETPTTLNPLGAKGAGEGATIGSIGAVANAVADALHPIGAKASDLPMTPEKVWNAIQAARKRES